MAVYNNPKTTLQYSQEMEFYFETLQSTKENYIIVGDSLYYVPYKDKSCVHQGKDKLSFIYMPDSIIKVSDCYMHIRGINPHLFTSEHRRTYTVFMAICPCRAQKFEENTAYCQFNVRINNGKISFFQKDIISFARHKNFTILDEKHFSNALHNLLKEAIMNNKALNPYFFTGYKQPTENSYVNTADFADSYALNCFLPVLLVSQGFCAENAKLQSSIDNITNFININPSSGMLLMYSMFSFTYYFINEVYEDNNNFYEIPVMPFNYFGKSPKVLQQNINLFANFFKADTYRTMDIKYSITLDSASYWLDRYTVFKDIPIIVHKTRGSVNPANKKLSEIINLRFNNSIDFFPVIISDKNLKIAEVLSFECSDDKILNSTEYKELKNSINMFFKVVIEFINCNREFIKHALESITYATLTSYKLCINEYDSIMTAFLQTSLDMVCKVLEKKGCNNYIDFKNLLQNILDRYMNDMNLSILPPNINSIHKNPVDSMSDKILNFVAKTYEEHRFDVSQKFVWTEPYDKFTDGEIFSPYEHDDRVLYIKNKLVEDFIKKSTSNVQVIKRRLYDKGIILKNGKRFTFKKHDKGEHICLCFYAEYLGLSDRDEHLSLN